MSTRGWEPAGRAGFTLSVCTAVSEVLPSVTELLSDAHLKKEAEKKTEG